MSTQKLVTTEAVNALGEKVEMRICSEPTSRPPTFTTSSATDNIHSEK